MKKMKGNKGFAGLPQDVKMTEYPKCSYVSGELDDSITGIDRAKDHSVSKAKKHLSNQK